MRSPRGTSVLRALLVPAVAVAIAACSQVPAPTAAAIATASIEAPASGSPAVPPPPAASAVIPGSPVTGVLLDIDSTGLAAVEGFTLRTGDGRTLDILLGTLENGDEFPPGHLAEHLATSAPLRVFFRADDTGLVAYRIEDAE